MKEANQQPNHIKSSTNLCQHRPQTVESNQVPPFGPQKLPPPNGLLPPSEASPSATSPFATRGASVNFTKKKNINPKRKNSQKIWREIWEILRFLLEKKRVHDLVVFCFVHHGEMCHFPSFQSSRTLLRPKSHLKQLPTVLEYAQWVFTCFHNFIPAFSLFGFRCSFLIQTGGFH